LPLDHRRVSLFLSPATRALSRAINVAAPIRETYTSCAHKRTLGSQRSRKTQSQKKACATNNQRPHFFVDETFHKGL
jgi:hypothetical protein